MGVPPFQGQGDHQAAEPSANAKAAKAGGGFRDLDKVYVCTASTFQVVFSLKRGVFRHRFGSPTPQSDTDPRPSNSVSERSGRALERNFEITWVFRGVAPRPLYNEKKAFSLWPRSDMSTEQDAASPAAAVLERRKGFTVSAPTPCMSACRERRSEHT